MSDIEVNIDLEYVQFEGELWLKKSQVNEILNEVAAQARAYVKKLKHKQRKLQAKLEKAEKVIEELENELKSFKSYGTDECPECISTHGHSNSGESYNRTTLYYRPCEHRLHKEQEK